jgi:hypothetical protein
MQCKMKHDGCRNTRAFKIAGQNLAGYGHSFDYGAVDQFLNRAIETQWYGEIKDATQSNIDECCGSSTG